MKYTCNCLFMIITQNNFIYSVNSMNTIPSADLWSGADDYEEEPPSATQSAISRQENDDADPYVVDEDEIRNRVGEYCTDRPTARVSDQVSDSLK